ncbi:G-protein coupled receptor 4-like [Lates japonicus]
MEASHLHYKFDFNDTSYNDTIYSDLHENDPLSEALHICVKFSVGLIISYPISWAVILIGFPLTLLAIYSLYSQVRDDHVAPVYVINLLITDLIQICCMVIWVVIRMMMQRVDGVEQQKYYMVRCVSTLIYYSAVLASVAFMVCVALERYLVVAWPLWYRLRRSIKFSVFVSIMACVFCFIEFIISLFVPISHSILLLLPFPLLIFSLAGTFKALPAAISLSLEEKRQIVGTLVLVLVNYTLLFLPWIIWLPLKSCCFSNTFDFYLWIFSVFIHFNPLADLVLCVFIRKDATEKLLTSPCCCRMTRREEQGQVATINE